MRQFAGGQFHIVRDERKLPAVRHGIAGVDAEVQQDLMELGGIAAHGPEIAGQKRIHRNIFGKRLAHHLLQLLHKSAEFHPLKFPAASAREQQDLPHHVRAAMRAGLHHAEQFTRFGVRGLATQELRAHEDWRERVVEIMRHAAGERADGVHALRAEKLLLQVFLLGDVAVDEQQLARLSGFIADQRPAARDDDDLTGARLQFQFAVPLTVFERGGAGGLRGGGVCGKHFQPLGRRSAPVPGRSHVRTANGLVVCGSVFIGQPCCARDGRTPAE